jgi:hypothetical protein
MGIVSRTNIETPPVLGSFEHTTTYGTKQPLAQFRKQESLTERLTEKLDS